MSVSWRRFIPRGHRFPCIMVQKIHRLRRRIRWRGSRNSQECTTALSIYTTGAFWARLITLQCSETVDCLFRVRLTRSYLDMSLLTLITPISRLSIWPSRPCLCLACMLYWRTAHIYLLVGNTWHYSRWIIQNSPIVEDCVLVSEVKAIPLSETVGWQPCNISRTRTRTCWTSARLGAKLKRRITALLPSSQGCHHFEKFID